MTTATTDTRNRLSARLIYNKAKSALADQPHTIFARVIEECNTPLLKQDLLCFACVEDNMPLFKAALDSDIDPQTDQMAEESFIEWVVDLESCIPYALEVLQRYPFNWQPYGMTFISTILSEGHNEAALELALSNCTGRIMARAFVDVHERALKSKQLMLILIQNDLIAWLSNLDKVLDVKSVTNAVAVYAARLQKIPPPRLPEGSRRDPLGPRTRSQSKK